MVEFDLEKAGEELVDKVIISRLFCYTLSTIRLETVDFDKGNGCVAFFEAQLRLSQIMSLEFSLTQKNLDCFEHYFVMAFFREM